MTSSPSDDTGNLVACPSKNCSFVTGQLEFEELIGKGKFGNIFRVQHSSSKFIFALETIAKSKIRQQATKLDEHLKQHSQLKHPYLLRLYGYFHDRGNIYLMLQYAPKGKLRDFLDIKGRLKEEEAAHLLVQLINALQLLHSRGIVHTKVNPKNIFMLKESHVLLKCPDLSHEESNKNAPFQLNYTAPEVVSGSRVTQSADVWSLGVLLFEMVCGSHLLDQEQAVNFIIPAHVSEEAMNLFPKLIVKNAEKRLSTKKILSQPWVKINTERQKKQKEEAKEPVQESTVAELAPPDDGFPPPAAENPPQPIRRTFGGSLENRKNI